MENENLNELEKELTIVQEEIAKAKALSQKSEEEEIWNWENQVPISDQLLISKTRTWCERCGTQVALPNEGLCYYCKKVEADLIMLPKN